MEVTKWSYFQYRKDHQYPIYIRFKQEEIKSKFTHLLDELGFQVLSEADAKRIPLQKAFTKILTIQEANPRLQQKINTSDSLDKYGHEVLSLQLGLPIYTYRKVGIMGFSLNKTLWDLFINPEITHTEQMVGLRVLFIRFLAHALSDQGILCYWGTVKDDTIIIMKQQQSFGEAVIIDLNKRMVFSNGGEMRLVSSAKIIRKDKEMRSSTYMSREDLIGFLSVNNCLLSFTGMTASMKKAIYELSSMTTATYAIGETHVNQ